MSWVAVAVGGSALVSGYMGSQASKRASQQQQDSADAATQLQREQYQQARSDAAPWTSTGVDALNQIRARAGLGPVAMPAGLSTGAPQMSEATFDADAYLRANPDVAANWRGGSAYDHYQMAGAKEGRQFTWTPEAQQQQQAYAQWQAQQPGGAGGGGQVVGEGSRGGLTGGGANGGGLLRNGTTGSVAGGQPVGNSSTFGFQAPQDRVTQVQGPLAQTGNRLTQVMSDPAAAEAMMKADPGYAFRLQQGQRALDRGAAARGGLLSGRAAMDTQDYVQGQASQEFSNAFARAGALDDRDYSRALTDSSRAWDQGMALDNRDYSRAWDLDQSSYNRLASLAGLGQTSQTNTSAAGMAFGNSAASNAIGAGNASAAGTIGSANAWSNAIGQGVGQYQTNQLYRNFMNGNKSTTTTPNYSALASDANSSMNTGSYYG